MQILWHNVLAALLTVAATVVLVRYSRPIVQFIAAIQYIGPSHDPDEQVRGLVAFGVVLVAVVAITKLVLENNRRNRGP